MRTRKVNQLDRHVIDFHGADVSFYRNAGIIADTLLQPGEAIEQRALAGIRITNDRDAGIYVSGNVDLIGRYAYF